MCSKTVENYSHFNDKARGGSAGNCPLFDNVEQRHEQEVQKAAEAAKEKLRRENPGLDDKDLEIQWSEEVKKRENQRMQAAQPPNLLVRPPFGQFAPPRPPAPPVPPQHQPPPGGPAGHQLHWGHPEHIHQPIDLRNYGLQAPPPPPAPPAPMVWPLYRGGAHVPVMGVGVDMPMFDARNQAIQIPDDLLGQVFGIGERHQALLHRGPLGPLYHAPLVPQPVDIPAQHNVGGLLFPRPAAYVAGHLLPRPAAPALPAAPAAPAPAPAAHPPRANAFRRR